MRRESPFSCIQLLLLALFLLATPSCSTASADRVVVAESHAECDACRTLVERFTVGWESVIRNQAQGGKAENKGNSPPAIVYNQEIEDYLQGFCKSDYISSPFSEAIRQGCSRIMDVHKREVVATFLSVTEQIGSHGKTTRGPTRLRRICQQLTNSCSQSYTNVSKITKCDACMRVVADAHYVLRRRVTPPHALSSIEATDALDSLCGDSYRRYDDAPRVVEKVCEDLMDEQVMKLLKAAQSKVIPDYHAACSGMGMCKAATQEL